MLTRAPSRRRMILSLLFALACVGLTIAAYTSFGGSVPFGPRGYRLGVMLPDAENLVDGSDVEIAGVTIGHVVDIQRRGNYALATMQIRPRYVPIRQDATAIVRTKTLLGETYIELAPGTGTAPPVFDGGTLSRR